MPVVGERDGLADVSQNRTQFTQHCLALTNITPVRYLQMIRLDAARRMLLEQPGLPVTAVAYECGFSSSQYFATCFKKRFGISPLDVRRLPMVAAE